MIELPKNINNTVSSFSKLPGVGEKTALRQVMAMTKWNSEDLIEFASSIKSLTDLRFCNECGMFSEEEICQLCKTAFRQEAKSICVVENISDLMAIEKSNNFNGLYHILGGVLNPLAGIGPDQLNINKLIERVERFSVKTLIIAVKHTVV